MPEIINSYSNGTEIKVSYSLGTPNTAGNYTPVTAELYVHRDGYGPSYDTNCTAYVNINGSRAMSYTSSFRIGTDWVKIGDTVTVNVSHNEDGTKVCNITGYFNSSITSKLQNLSVSSNITLPTIARASTPSMSDFTIGNSVRIYTNRASGAFTHTITYTFGNSSRTLASGVESYFDWPTANDANALLSQVQGLSSGTGTIILDTYSGGTHIGDSKQVGFTAYVPAPTTADNLSFNVGQAVTINLHRNSALYMHNVDVIFGSWSKNILTGSTASTCTWDTSADKNSLYAQLPLNTGDFKIRVSTYCGTLHIGDSDAKLTAAVVNGNPIFSDFTFQDTNPATVALTGDNKKLVCGQSKVTVTISAANKATSNTGAIIKNYTVTCGEKTVTVPFASADVTAETENPSSGTIQVTATDSRSNQTVVSKQADFVEYAVPTITKADLRRDNDIDPKTKLTVSGKFWNGNFGAVANALTLKYAYKSTSSDTWATASTVPAICDGSSFDFDAYIDGDLGVDGFSNDGSFDLMVYAEDKLSTVTKQPTLSRGVPLVDFEKHGLGIGKVWERGALDVAGDIYCKNALLNSHINPIYVADGTDFNALTTPGWYYGNDNNAVQNCRNIPTKLAFVMEVIKCENMVCQNFRCCNAETAYMRTYMNDSWTSWFKVWTQANDGSSSGLDADFLDGKHASEFRTKNTEMAPDMDLNNLKDMYAGRTYFYFSGLNAPPSCGYGFIKIEYYDGTQFAPYGDGAITKLTLQRATDWTGQREFIRVYNYHQNSWSSWEPTKLRYVNGSNVGTPASDGTMTINTGLNVVVAAGAYNGDYAANLQQLTQVYSILGNSGSFVVMSRDMTRASPMISFQRINWWALGY